MLYAKEERNECVRAAHPYIHSVDWLRLDRVMLLANHSRQLVKPCNAACQS
jgi:hypothetical protein